jgi:MFS transporter, ACS family, allantoate permease
MLPGGLINQRQIIVRSFGFTTLETTLLGCVDGSLEILTIWSGVEIAARIRNGRAWVGAVYFMPNLLGVFLVEFLPWHNKVGLLLGVWLNGEFGMLLIHRPSPDVFML